MHYSARVPRRSRPAGETLPPSILIDGEGLLHALAVIALGGRRAAEGDGPADLARRLATFAFAALAWVPFFTSADVSWGGLARMLARMVVPVVP